MSATADVTELLRQTTWMRRLALSLVRDEAMADDLVQETWVQALRNPPRAGETVRPWLAEVLRNVLRGRFRADSRRTRREEAAPDAAAVKSPEQLVTAMELQRELADEVLRLEDPYRTTLLLVFHQGLSPTEIAQRDGVPAGTVRWRLSEGLAQLRVRLDRKHGNRHAWLGALAPLLGRPPVVVTPWKGLTMMKLVLLISVAAAAVGVATQTGNRTSATKTATAVSATTTAATTTAAAAPGRPVHVGKAARTALLQRMQVVRKAAPIAQLDKAYVSHQMRELIPLVEECFQSGVEANPNLHGRLVVAMTIVGDPGVGGLVADSQVVDEKSTITDPHVRECIQETMYAAQFPPPPADGELHIEYPFTLGAEDPLNGHTLDADQHARVESLLETGKWPDGTPLSAEQRQKLEQRFSK